MDRAYAVLTWTLFPRRAVESASQLLAHRSNHAMKPLLYSPAHVRGLTESFEHCVPLFDDSEGLCTIRLPYGEWPQNFPTIHLQIVQSIAREGRHWSFDVRDVVSDTWLPLASFDTAAGERERGLRFGLPQPNERLFDRGKLTLRYHTTNGEAVFDLLPSARPSRPSRGLTPPRGVPAPVAAIVAQRTNPVATAVPQSPPRPAFERSATKTLTWKG